jgi:hypothetical protein
MATYKIEMMSMDSYNRYMGGYWDYRVEKINIEAETAEEAVAIAKAKYSEMVINEGWVKTLEELAAIEAEKIAEAKAEAEREAAKKARKAEREAAKAAEMGLTIEEYTERKKLAAKARRYENEAAKMETEIKALLEEIEWRKRKAAEIKEKLGL